MELTINNLYFKYDENTNCISTYDSTTNRFVSYIHVNPNEAMNKNSFVNTCERWATASTNSQDALYQGVDYNSWY